MIAKPTISSQTYNLHLGDNLATLKTYPDNHFDSVITDPPYGISFLGKGWDEHTGEVNLYKECLRVLKPGGHLMAFSAARTYHRLATSIEEAGFEIRDQIMWIYSSGFPKSQDVGKCIDRALGKEGIKGPLKRGAGRLIQQTDADGNRDNESGVWANEVNCNPYHMLPESDEAKQWSGWGTALKPAHEPIVMARKPSKLSIAKNVQKYGVGAINVDASRVGYEIVTTVIKRNDENTRWYGPRADGQGLPKVVDLETNKGRFPSNVLGDIPDYQKYFYKPTYDYRLKEGTGSIVINRIKEILCRQNTSSS